MNDKVLDKLVDAPPKVKRNAVDVGKALELKHKGLSMQEIGNQFGVSKQAVHQHICRIEKLLASPQELEKYREKQAEVMDSIGIRYGERLLDEDAIKGASALQAATVMAISVDKARLIRGQNTATVLVVHANAVREASKAWDADPEDAEVVE